MNLSMEDLWVMECSMLHVLVKSLVPYPRSNGLLLMKSIIKGILFIVKNYSGDIMNFEMGADMIDFDHETILVNDDVALKTLLLQLEEEVLLVHDS